MADRCARCGNTPDALIHGQPHGTRIEIGFASEETHPFTPTPVPAASERMTAEKLIDDLERHAAWAVKNADAAEVWERESDKRKWTAADTLYGRAATMIRTLTARAEAAEARAETARAAAQDTKAELLGWLRTIAGGRRASIGSIDNTYCPQMSRERVDAAIAKLTAPPTTAKEG